MQDLVVFDLRSQNELLKERLLELVAEGSGAKAEIERLRSELDRAISRKKFREQEVRSHAYRIEVLKGELEKTESKLRVSERDLRSSERTRIALQNSASWRITRPLRTLKTAAGRLFLATFGPRYSRSDSISRQPAAIPHAVSAAPVKAEAGAGSVRSQNAWLEDTPALTQDIELIRASGLFDDRYYSTMYSDRIARGEDPLTHFCRVGWRQKLDPSERFIVAGYLAANPLVAKSDENPLVHYLKSLGGLDLAAPSTSSLKTGSGAVGRIAVFTAIAASYDDLAEPVVAPEGVDYYAFTDRDIADDSVWKKREFDYFHHDPTRTARFVKTHPHLYFQDYDVSIWLDANLALHVDPRDIAGVLRPDVQFASWHHPLRDSVYDEAIECARRKKDADAVQHQIARYRTLGLAEKSGLMETSVIVRKHNDPRVIEAMNLWWKEIDNGSRRDQLSLPYVLWNRELSVDYLARPGICMRSDHRFSYRRHNRK